jgi:transposase InsO family protein
MHEPSIRVRETLAAAFELPTEALLVRAGLSRGGRKRRAAARPDRNRDPRRQAADRHPEASTARRLPQLQGPVRLIDTTAEQWLTDITEHPTREVDQSQPTAALTCNALGMATEQRDAVRGTVIRSDHGTQFTAWTFSERARTSGLLASNCAPLHRTRGSPRSPRNPVRLEEIR